MQMRIDRRYTRLADTRTLKCRESDLFIEFASGIVSVIRRYACMACDVRLCVFVGWDPSSENAFSQTHKRQANKGQWIQQEIDGLQ